LYFNALIFPLIPQLSPDGIPYQGNRLRHISDNFIYSLYGLRFSQGEMHPMWTTENSVQVSWRSLKQVDMEEA
jgi:hypothetical protein